MTFTRVALLKYATSNSIKSIIKPSPSGLSFYSSLDWNSVLATYTAGFTMTSATYDSAKNEVTVECTYNSSINSSNPVEYTVQSSASTFLQFVNNSRASLVLSSDNNQDIEAYDDDTYSQADDVKTGSLAVGGVAFLLFFLGALRGKLVAL